ncbi:MAG: divalent-cation tolerance protein CutA [Alphaproteobacteria bacterium]|nr:MAG: divalent-cation tolerance protein CutA [Alphaproteobacteria bacterium]
MTAECVTVYITAADEGEARKLAETLVQERLAACANILGPINSIYWWDGGVQNGAEVALMLKTRKTLFEKLKKRAVELHSYDCPCITAWDIAAGHQPYLDWISVETHGVK